MGPGAGSNESDGVKGQLPREAEILSAEGEFQNQKSPHFILTGKITTTFRMALTLGTVKLSG